MPGGKKKRAEKKALKAVRFLDSRLQELGLAVSICRVLVPCIRVQISQLQAA